MADGPVDNLPDGMDAYAGYVNVSGIGKTFAPVVSKFPNAKHLSITTNSSVADCADVEAGGMLGWRDYTVGYCSVARVNALVAQLGRPLKLWTAHYDPTIGPHICGPDTCNYKVSGQPLVTHADGTQWTDHGGAFDESLLRDDFFSFQVPKPTLSEVEIMAITQLTDGKLAISAIGAGQSDGHQLVFITNADGTGGSVIDVTDGVGAKGPNGSLYTVKG